MNTNLERRLLRKGAKLVHPRTAYLLTHIDVPTLPEDMPGYSSEQFPFYLHQNNSTTEEVMDYVLRCHQAACTLFGDVDFDFMCLRVYDEQGLPPHSDYDFTDEDTYRKVSLVQNVSGFERPLYFRRPIEPDKDDARLEEFALLIPDTQILAMGNDLVKDYQHFIPGDEAVGVRSIITRFSLVDWPIEEEDETDG